MSFYTLSECASFIHEDSVEVLFIFNNTRVISIRGNQDKIRIFLKDLTESFEPSTLELGDIVYKYYPETSKFRATKGSHMFEGYIRKDKFRSISKTKNRISSRKSRKSTVPFAS